MIIRKATAGETQQIVNHALIVLEEATMGHVEPKEEKAHEIITPFLAAGGYYLVITEKNSIQGWIGVGSRFDYYIDEIVGFIPEIYIFERYRRKGLAEKLCEEVFKRLKKEGYNKVQLNVFAGNKVKSLYHKLGFEDVSTLMEKKLWCN
ncbi:GNAT family N-acetyltransferase [Virgibacillus sp. C22-A2]|uniref:GNAT family N-acetyltransferase n=1 Tax=Virgibacillus tibetensis TaxID=3042313 RepID=A0ABU6KHM0_9BACI|nr:GNAT family N-acetyltransferase [Virgibacillus sp. C22-A2]